MYMSQKVLCSGKYTQIQQDGDLDHRHIQVCSFEKVIAIRAREHPLFQQSRQWVKELYLSLYLPSLFIFSHTVLPLRQFCFIHSMRGPTGQKSVYRKETKSEKILVGKWERNSALVYTLFCTSMKYCLKLLMHLPTTCHVWTGNSYRIRPKVTTIQVSSLVPMATPAIL